MKILIVKTSSLGDILHAFPLLSYLKQVAPGCQIDWVVEKPFAGLVEANPLVNRTLKVQTKLWRKSLWKKETRSEVFSFLKELRSVSYDLLFDLQGNIKSGLITALARSPIKVGFDRKSVPEWPNLLFTNKRYHPPEGQNIRLDYLSLAQSHFKDFNRYDQPLALKTTVAEKESAEQLLAHSNLKSQMKVVVCPGSAWTNKQLSKQTLIEFLQLMQLESGCSFLFVWGNQEEQKMATELNSHFPFHSLIAPKVSLPTLHFIMSKMDLVIAMDSLPLHLAGTTQTPTFSVFGSSSAKKYNPVGEQNYAFQGTCPYGRTFVKRCPILRTCKTGSCIKDLSGELLFTQFKKWWSTSCQSCHR